VLSAHILPYCFKLVVKLKKVSGVFENFALGERSVEGSVVGKGDPLPDFDLT
jgi:hypothetical protein